MGLFGAPKEKGLQLYFRDDGRFIFRRLELEDTFLEEKNNEHVIIRGWKHFFKNQFPFAGYKGIKPGMVTLSCGRDVVLDPYDLVPDTEKPDKGTKELIKPIVRATNIVKWLVEVGNARRLKLMAKRAKNVATDRIILFLGAGLMVELLIIAIIVLQKRSEHG